MVGRVGSFGIIVVEQASRRRDHIGVSGSEASSDEIATVVVCLQKIPGVLANREFDIRIIRGLAAASLTLHDGSQIISDTIVVLKTVVTTLPTTMGPSTSISHDPCSEDGCSILA